HVAGLGNFFEHERGVENRQAEPAILLRHGHAENAQFGERLHIVPREGAVHPARGALAELALRQFADGRDKTALLVGQGRKHGRPSWAAGSGVWRGGYAATTASRGGAGSARVAPRAGA